MLKIFFGTMPEAIYNTSMYFDNVYLDKWITDPFAQKIIKAIDKGEVLSASAIKSKALGVIPVTGLSGGVKTLLLIRNEPQKIFNASTCGDNCARWILEIAKECKQDVVINLYHIMDFGSKPFELEILNNHKIIHSMEELVEPAGFFIKEGMIT
ncbi:MULTISPECIES: DUF4869 domain-containing protein [Eubacteriales]|uniref:Uncharacterized protein DUF4869 n=1 Tax=Allofournierella massiliensis TaxID=1650663 RepID=A0A4R1QTW7_9FIRM|nr:MULTISPECIES: DUF4869 domain-containing protein [Eubacteriales]OUP23501.1 DUF4869 domain-containing protein [Gemmiger sp. An194]TCL53570.1 uncharacterized protein DUF4869 [Fournierella massiliensis]